MLRPNIWVEKIENSPCRVPGWLRLSAARSGSDWSKSFPSDFSKMGELRRRRRGEGGRGAPLLQNRGQFGPRQNMLRVSDPFCQNSTSTTVPGQAPKNILCVGFNVDFFVPPPFLLLESTHSPLFMDLFPKSKSRNDEAGKYTLLRSQRYKIFIKYANPFPQLPICS